MKERLDDLPPLAEPDEDGSWPGPDRDERPRSKPAAGKLTARRFVCDDPTAIPMREWYLGRHLIKGFVSATVSPGGIGKSSLAIAECISLAAGRDLIGHPPYGRRRVWYINLEDPADELDRRVMATLMHYGLTPADLGGRLFVNSGRDTEIVVARQDRTGIAIAEPVVEALTKTIMGNMIDVVVVDPFVSCHAVNENDNMAVNAVVTVWADLAERTGIAVELIHHAKKVGGNEVTMEDARGASALLAKVRAGRVLNVMTREEGERAGVENRRLHFRVDSGKGNLAPPSSDASTWFRLQSVTLPNGGNLGGTPLDGDSVGVVTPWQWPDAFADITAADLRAAQAAVAAGGPWRENVQAKDWVGHAIGPAIRLDPADKRGQERIKTLLKTWIANGMFMVVTGKNEKGRDTPLVQVGRLASDEGE